MTTRRWTRWGTTGVVALLMLGLSGPSWAGGRFGRTRGRAVAPTAAVRPPGTAPSPMLGNFYPEPALFLAGRTLSGGGYAPFGNFYMGGGLPVDGPLSVFRSEATHVVTYRRGYNGQVEAVPATAFSYPNEPWLSPVVYPSRANYFYYRPNPLSAPPEWYSSINWIDQN